MTDVQKRTGATSRRWGQERRFEFIDFRLLWDGRLNRADLTSYFGISVPQASMDLALYQQLAPDNTIYDKQQKAYVIGPAFRPLTEPLSAYPFLNSMRQVQTGMLPKESTFLGWCPPNGVVQLPTRRIEVDILRQALASIRINSEISIRYQSMHHPAPEVRSISPHAIVFDGVRWHLRAFCYRHGDFRDFVLSRITEVAHQNHPGIDPSTDQSWHSPAIVVISPAPHLSEGQRSAIAADYGMIEGNLRIETREALLLYLVQQIPLYGLGGRARHNHIVIANRAELQPIFERLGIDVD